MVSKITLEQERENYGEFIHENLFKYEIETYKNTLLGLTTSKPVPPVAPGKLLFFTKKDEEFNVGTPVHAGLFNEVFKELDDAIAALPNGPIELPRKGYSLTKNQEKLNAGRFVREKLFMSKVSNLKDAIQQIKDRPVAPASPTATYNADKSITVTLPALTGTAKSYIIHTGGANEAEASTAIHMYYTEGTTFTLPADLVQPHKTGDKLYFFAQAYSVTESKGTTPAEKAMNLHNSSNIGSEWSPAVSVTAS